MSRIQDIVAQIRHAVFGKDVRENIALGIETCYNEEVEKNEALERNKINKPATEGPPGYVLRNEGNGVTSWTSYDTKLNKPATDGQSGMLLQSNGNGSTSWTSYASPTDEQVATAVEEWLDDHPSATTTVQDKSLTEKKFSDKLKAQTFPILNLMYKKTAVQKDAWSYQGNNEFLKDYAIQSMCYDSYRDRYIVGFSHRTNNTYSLLMIMKEPDFGLDPSTNVISYVARTYNHCNDLAYYPGSGDGTDDRIYVVGGTSSVWILDAETLGYIDFKTISGLGTNEGVWEISVYSDGSIYLNTGAHARKYTHDFSSYTAVSTYDNYNFEQYFGLGDSSKVYYCAQGSFIYNDVPYMIYNVGEPVNSGWWGAYITSFDANGLIFARKVATEYEVEAADIVGNKIVFACGQVWLNFAEAFLDVPDVSDSQVTRHSIPSGADLDYYKTPGTYFSQNAGISASLSHIPDFSQYYGFTLEVMRSGYDNVRQLLYTNNFWSTGSIYTRGYAVTPKLWGEWFLLTGSKAELGKEIYENKILEGVYGYITSSGTELTLHIPLDFNQSYTVFNITQLIVTLRIPSGGYVIGDGAGADITQYLPPKHIVYKEEQNLLFMVIEKSDGWIPNVNNIPVIGRCTMTATFNT